MDSERIKAIHQATAYPDSHSVMQALLQVWNECEQEKHSPVPSVEEIYEFLHCNEDDELVEDMQIAKAIHTWLTERGK